MLIRKYKPEDCLNVIRIFFDTVHTVNAKDYEEAQLNVWATGKEAPEKWNRSLMEHYSVAAVEDEKIVGFGDIDETGYLDRLYVHKDYQGRGIATAICDELERQISDKNIVTHASVTARPFFEKRGYRMVKEQQVERQGIFLKNYVMEKILQENVVK